MAQLSQTKFQTAGTRNFCFAGYPSAKIHKESTGSGWNQHLIFGDYIQILDLEVKNNRILVKSRNSRGWISVDKVQRERVLEVNFIDIGQGDGCHVVTPDDQHILIDAGEGDNMVRYLVWRFNLYGKTTPLPIPFNVIISHSDEDHFGGFGHIFKSPLFQIAKIFHNGIVQRPGDAHDFGQVTAGYITSLVKDTAEMLTIISDPQKRKGTNSKYPQVLWAALTHNPGVTFKMLSKQDGFVDGFDALNQVNGRHLSLKLLAPITEKRNGKDALPFIKDVGKSKNGHSVMIRLDYGHVRLLLGGDINEEAGEAIVDHYKNAGALGELQVDAAKACHHGSNHFHLPFIEAVNAAATVISSGDEENYAHPRPDAIGALGKCGFGDRPLIFSTEIARSGKEVSRKSLEKVNKLQNEVAALRIQRVAIIAAGTNTPADQAKLEEIKKSLIAKNKTINSHLTKYGMINLRTDGEKMIIAQKLEIDAPWGKWDIHELKFDPAAGRFTLVS